MLPSPFRSTSAQYTGGRGSAPFGLWHATHVPCRTVLTFAKRIEAGAGLSDGFTTTRNCTGVLCVAPLAATSCKTYVPALAAVSGACSEVAFARVAPPRPETIDQVYALA